MPLNPLREPKSPHFDSVPIPVEFLILHYTAQSLQGSLNIFCGEKAVSCHLLIDEDGKIFELVKSWRGECHRAFHAGKSRRADPENPSKIWKSFNRFSIGIELVNWNGNFFPYTEAQYQSLFQAVRHLKTLYSKLRNPHRILGHEHISGRRGKCDPGRLFDWPRLFKEVYGDTPPPFRYPRISERHFKHLAPLIRKIPLKDEPAQKMSLILENPMPLWIKKIQLKRLIRK